MLEVEADAEAWGPGDWDALARRAVEAAIANSPFVGILVRDVVFEVSVKFAGDEEVRRLNADYRDKDKPTNVLSFPMIQRDLIEATQNGESDGEALLGDIILAKDVCEREAADKGVSVETHATHLVVHGTYHLLGFDHLEDVEAEEMEDLERGALASLGIDDPYAVEES